MGIRGLSSFIHGNGSILLEHYELHDCKVLIDGLNLLGHLFQGSSLAFDLGGDYDRFAIICRRFFQTLKSCNVKPYVIFDGGKDPNLRKLNTVKKRKQNRIINVKNQIFSTGKTKEAVMPILASKVFKNVVKELDIPYASCNFEADRETAVLAKRWSCPVMTNDSDFFIYDLVGGVIPLRDLNMTAIMGEDYQFIPVKIYRCSYFTQKYPASIRPIVLPALASVLGNDTLDESLFRKFYGQAEIPDRQNFKFKIEKCSRRFRASLYWLDSIPSNRKNTFSGVLQYLPKTKREAIERELNRSVKDYFDLVDFNDLHLEKFFSIFDQPRDLRDFKTFDYPGLKDKNGYEVPEWFVGALRRCEISSDVQGALTVGFVTLDCQIEKIEDVSSYECSRHIRESCYGVLFPERNVEIVEYDRWKDKLEERKLSPRVFPFSWYIRQDPDESNKRDRQLILFAALEFLDFEQENELQGGGLTKTTRLFTAILFSWIKNSNPKVSQNAVYSLIVTVFYLNTKYLTSANRLKDAFVSKPGKAFDAVQKTLTQSTEDQIETFIDGVCSILEKRQIRPGRFKSVYMFSQFQAVFDDTTQLNQALAQPIRLMIPSLVYNGTIACKLFDELEAQKSTAKFMDTLFGSDSPFQRLFRSIYDILKVECATSGCVN